MYYRSQWTPFTIIGFNMHAADLACKELGYSCAARYANVGYLGCVSNSEILGVLPYTGSSYIGWLEVMNK